MFLHNVRLGFANNSSSSHSLLLLKPGVDVPKEVWDGELGFGWEDFTLVSKEAKAAYVSALFLDQLRTAFGDERAMIILSEMVGLSPELAKEAQSSSYAYVDHQSAVRLPRTFTDQPDLRFLQWYASYMQRDDVVILGGNDNSDGHPLAESDLGQHATNSDLGYGELRSRWDPQTNTVTLFNPATGAKIRFGESPFSKHETPMARLSAPELVDIKITDWCDAGCAYCYQGSTKVGQHASLDTIRQIAKKLGEWQVFEVALGGGEPTAHPDFLEILKIFRAEGVVPNFTTRSMKWLKGPDAGEILSLAGSYAFSVDKWGSKAREWADLQRSSPKRGTCQIVPQVMMHEDVVLTLAETARAHIGVTLLGYKDTGFGAEYRTAHRVREPDCWVEDVNAYRQQTRSYLRVSIDTALARDEAAMTRLSVEPYMYHVKEGAVSAYVDAVTGRWGPSSYCGEGRMVPWDEDLTTFQTWGLA